MRQNSLLRVVSLVLALVVFQPASGLVETAYKPLEPLPVHINTTRNIVDALASRHYVTTYLDDALSEKILDAYIEDLDPAKSYFTAADIEEFQQYRHEMDNLLRRGDVTPAFMIFNRYHQRVMNSFEKSIALVEAGPGSFDFTADEDLHIDRKDAPWASSVEELDDLARKRVKNAWLSLKLTDKEPDKIRELLLKRYQNRLTRTRQTNSEDVFQLYMNSFTRTYDPHTQYFSPQTSENFNINMSLSLEGIGAVLQNEDEYTKVVSLVPAGPADKSKQIFPNDKIVAVGQGEAGDMVDVIGWRLDEVVQLIRGKKDTIVKLDVVPAASKDSAASKVVRITRNTVKLEEQSAKSEIIEVKQFGSTHKIGVINIPTFYIDFQAYQQGDPNFKSTTRDVHKLLVDLKAEGVEGVVIDLRDNGGGSLQEARTLTGLFINSGPTVQIRSKSNRVDILSDRDLETVYSGPLAVLVNRLSASASEIFAGAIQDYQRGLIIGSQTFGKGTVQSLLPLNRGQLKLTQAKFYRISGESTQHKGIIPDIAYPDDYDPEAIGESTLEGPLPWDKIQPTAYRTSANLTPMIPDLRNLHFERVAHDPEFTYLKDATDYRRERRNDKYITLNETKRVSEKNSDDAFWLALENKKRAGLGEPVLASLDELKAENQVVAANTGGSGGITTSSDPDAVDGEQGQESMQGNEMAGVVTLPSANGEASPSESPAPAKVDETTGVTELPKPDAYLVESSNILLDYISLTNRTASQKAVGQPI